MASPALLVETVSKATGVPQASVVDFDRRLVVAGLRTKAGRGFNAARMTPLDAARLLTAILGSHQANRAANAVTHFAETAVDPRRSSNGLFEVTRLADLTALAPGHGFVDGLTGLITSAATGSLAAMIASSDVEPPRIEITALTRAVIGRIRISGLPSGMTASLEYRMSHGRQALARPVTQDLEQSRRVTGHTVFALASLFKEKSV